MYYKKRGITAPIMKNGSTYSENYFYNGYMFLKYEGKNMPSEPLVEITEEEYNQNRPIFAEPETPQPTNADILAEVKKTQSEVIDKYTLELMERGVL